MSFSINALQRWLATVEHPVEVRELVGAIHEYSHKNGDALNHDRYVHKSAERLDKWLDEQEAAQPVNAPDAAKPPCQHENHETVWHCLDCGEYI